MTKYKDKKNILILGATGMLGSAALRFFAESPGYEVVGSVRSESGRRLLPIEFRDHVDVGVDVENSDSLTALFARVEPDVVINCIGVVKQLEASNDVLKAVPINTLIPHRLARLSELVGARFIHVSTDCVFTGIKGQYAESDVADARDLYGLSKLLGEVDASHALTIRTSIIGHEIAEPHGLVGWFLKQEGSVKGYSRAIFSGLPTFELMRVVRDFILPQRDLHGLYHVSAAPISKFDLLQLVAREYQKRIEIIPDATLVIDRSLDSSRFQAATGYVAPDWPQLVAGMRFFG